MASVSTVVTRGFRAVVNLLLTRGFGIGAAAPALTPGAYLWSREPGRFLWSREPGRYLTMPATAAPYDFLGTFYLSTGGTTGDVRRLGVRFANREEIVAGETLSGTPTASVEGNPASPVISAVAYSGTNLLFTVTVGAATAAGLYVVRFHAESSGGAKWEPWAYLKLEDTTP